MKALLTIGLVAVSSAALTDPVQCPLQGTWKSDAARTLADIVGNDAMSPMGMTLSVSADLFGHMTHEWTCTELRAWFDYDVRAEATPYKILEMDAESVLVTFPDGSEHDLRIIFEGSCYKIRFGDRRYHEYFCPVEK